MLLSLLQVPLVQKHESSAWNEIDSKDTQKRKRGIITSTELSIGSVSSEWRFVKHCINFTKVWSSEQESKGRCTLCRKQVIYLDLDVFTVIFQVVATLAN